MTLEELEAELVDCVDELAQWLKSSGISPSRVTVHVPRKVLIHWMSARRQIDVGPHGSEYVIPDRSLDLLGSEFVMMTQVGPVRLVPCSERTISWTVRSEQPANLG